MTIKNKLATFILLLTPFAFDQDSNYVFGWSHLEDTELILPRGGSTQGPPVTLDDTPSQAWLDLQNPKANKFEKDRQAILAMQGRYRVNFDFMETMGFVAEYQPERPYQSWGTEFVIAIEDRDDFISLQHIMVMYFELEDDLVSEPIVVKHWRQDWQYQDASLHTYTGNNTWSKSLFLGVKEKAHGHKQSTKLMTPQGIRVLVHGSTMMDFLLGLAMRHGGHYQEEKQQQETTMM